jgi:arylsulfatase A-like enzyme
MILLALFFVTSVITGDSLSVRNGDFLIDELGENNISHSVEQWYVSSVADGNFNDFVFRHDRQFSRYAPLASIATLSGYLYQNIGVTGQGVDSFAVEVDLLKRSIRDWGDLRVMVFVGDPVDTGNGVDILGDENLEKVGSYTFSLDNTPISSPQADIAFAMATGIFDLSDYKSGASIWLRFDGSAAGSNSSVHFTNVQLHLNPHLTPKIDEFSVSQNYSVTPGSAINVNWTVRDAETLTFVMNDEVIHETSMLSGSIQVVAEESAELTLIAENPFATRNASKRVIFLTGDRLPPNIILFHVDDMGWSDWGHNGRDTGSDLYQTPVLDTFAKSGVWFPNGYAPSPVCSPSRGALMSGKSPARTKLSNWIPGGAAHQGKPIREADWFRRLGLDEMNLAKSFNELGYRTVHVGKWHLGEATNAETDPTRHGFDINIGGTDKGNPPTGYWPDANGSFGLPGLDQGYGQSDYLTDVLTDQALEQIDIAVASSNPLMLHLSHYAPHTPIQAPAVTVAKYEAILSDGQQRIHTNPVYAAMMDHVDQSLNRVLQRLNDLDIFDNTIIFFISDNGGLLPITSNLPLRGGKGHEFEGAVRVPFIVSWPGTLASESVSDMPVVHMDIFPTLLDLVGAPATFVDRHLFDGETIANELKQPGGNKRVEPIVLHYPHYSPQGGTPHSMVRDGDLKLTYFYSDNELFLFDVGENPNETVNLWNERREDGARLFDHLARRLNHFNANFPSTHDGKSLAPSVAVSMKDVFTPGWGDLWFGNISSGNGKPSFPVNANYIFRGDDANWIYLSEISSYENAIIFDFSGNHWIWSRYDIWPWAFNLEAETWFQVGINLRRH